MLLGDVIVSKLHAYDYEIVLFRHTISTCITNTIMELFVRRVMVFCLFQTFCAYKNKEHVISLQ